MPNAGDRTADIDETVGVGQRPSPRPPGGPRHTNTGNGLVSPLPADRLRGWLVTLSITAIAAVVRFWNLGFPTDKGTPIFDEKHYVPQAWQMLRNGGYEDNPGYELVVHPPVGKQLIALGEWLVGGYNGWGWRLTAAAAGVVMVLLTVRIARRLTRSTFLGAVAGILLVCDGVSHVQSRMGMLDIFQAMFVLAAFGCLVVDRDQMRERMSLVLAEGRIGDSRWGPRLGFRWWRFGGGLMLGLACGTKWNGIYYIVAFGLLSVIWDALARRSAGVRRPWMGTLVRDTAPALGSLVAVPLLLYLGAWAGWFASETATDRHAVEINGHVGFTSLPDTIRSLLYYQLNVLHFHTTLTSGTHPHPWESKPWAWPMGMRPMLYYYESGPAANGCGLDSCVSATMLIGTPAMWWLTLPAGAWAVWRSAFRVDWRYCAVLVGYAAGYLPWFTNLDRQMYYFYATPLAPFLVLGLTLVLGEILGAARAGYERRQTGLLLVALYVGLVVANFVWLWPILNGNPIAPDHWDAELWLPSWR